MSIVYLGNCNFEEIDRSEMEVDPWGRDSMRVTVAGRKDRLDDYVNLLRRNQHSEVYPGLRLKTWRPRTDRSWGYVDLDFAGLLDNTPRDPVEIASIRRQTVQLTSKSGMQTEIEYFAPALTIRYTAFTRPTRALNEGRLLYNSQAWEITNRRGNTKGRLIRRTRAGLGDTDGDFLYNTEVVTVSLDSEEDAGLWLVTEVNEGRFTQDEAVKRRVPVGSIAGGSPIIGK